MAVPPPPPTVDAAIVSSVDRLQKVLMLPGNWRHSFSLRLSADSASILVSWSSPAAPVKPRSGGADEGKKKKKKSPSSIRKSNERAAAHRVRVLDRQCVISPQQPHLNPHLPPFVPNSVSSLTPAAESVKDIGAVPSQTGTVFLAPLPEDPGPGPSEERRVEKRERRGEEKREEKRKNASLNQLSQVWGQQKVDLAANEHKRLFEGLREGERAGDVERIKQYSQRMDSLAGVGAAAQLITIFKSGGGEGMLDGLDGYG
jgi:hypothetical protein